MIDYAINTKNDIVKIVKESDELAFVQSEVRLPDSYRVDVYLKKIDGKWFFVDDKATAHVLADIYDIGDKDFKHFVQKTLEMYNVITKNNELFLPINDESVLWMKYFEFTTCISQLISMYIYFE